MMAEDFMHLIREGHLEQGASAGDESECIKLSIAISLKRLADAFERAEKHATGDRS